MLLWIAVFIRRTTYDYSALRVCLLSQWPETRNHIAKTLPEMRLRPTAVGCRSAGGETHKEDTNYHVKKLHWTAIIDARVRKSMLETASCNNHIFDQTELMQRQLRCEASNCDKEQRRSDGKL